MEDLMTIQEQETAKKTLLNAEPQPLSTLEIPAMKPMQKTVIETEEETEEYFLNVGPQHPSTHGVLHLQIKLDGETIEDVEPVLGYVHRAVEKMSESLNYRQFIQVTSRLDYLSAHINNLACAMAVEKAMQVEIPPRAIYIRTILNELTRLASHQLWWGAAGLDLGAVTPFFLAFRDREDITTMFEEVCGSRLTMNYIVPGGVMWDIPADFNTKVKKILDDFEHNLPEYDQLLTGNEIFLERNSNVGILSKEDALSYGCTGPVARGSGLSCDVRKWFPYEGYDKITFDEIMRTKGDCLARYEVRMDEMRESVKIIRQMIDEIPEGDFTAKVKKVIKLPAGDFYERVETARGEFGVYLVSDGKGNPYRIKYRSPGFSNLAALPAMARGGKIGDLVAIMASLDLVIPDIDR
ncbi:MAG: NADH-quinone oxidoreductase subunit D [Bacteroidia bacterium]